MLDYPRKSPSCQKLGFSALVYLFSQLWNNFPPEFTYALLAVNLNVYLTKIAMLNTQILKGHKTILHNLGLKRLVKF